MNAALHEFAWPRQKRGDFRAAAIFVFVLWFAGFIFFNVMNEVNEEPSCGNNKCERFAEVDELTSCPRDCTFNAKPAKPVCGNGECEVFGGIDEFYTCGWGTANDCNVQCVPSNCWAQYCGGLCGGISPPISPPVQGASDRYDVKVYYAYNPGDKDAAVVANIVPIFTRASQLLENYNGMTLTATIEEVPLTFDIAPAHDIYYPPDDRTRIWRELDAQVDLQTDVTAFDSIWLVLAGTTGGCFSIDYKTPIYCDGDHFSPSTLNAPILTIHEFLHSFGCTDINGGSPGCIMGDLRVTSISDATLCDCRDRFQSINYGKQTYGEYVGTGRTERVCTIPC